MNKYIITFSVLSVNLLLYGCSRTVASNPSTLDSEQTTELQSSLADDFINIEQTKADTIPDESEAAEILKHTPVEQGGPYGKISLSIPDGWHYETCPTDSENLTNGLYGIRFYPEDATEGYIDLFYIDFFGVCGTGLSEETVTIAGNLANIGTYDNHTYWDFISFQNSYSGIVALTYNVESWWDSYSGQVMDILNTLSYDTSKKEGGAYIRSSESEADKIGLLFELKQITPTGATLVFHQYDEKTPTGELEYGDAFVLEALKNDKWEEVPAALSEYGFNAVAHTIPSRDSFEQKLNWEWLYGTLEPGSYRIKKEIMDFRASGDFDSYTVYAQFILN